MATKRPLEHTGPHTGPAYPLEMLRSKERSSVMRPHVDAKKHIQRAGLEVGSKTPRGQMLRQFGPPPVGPHTASPGERHASENICVY